jgi:hypothetical protein
LLEKYGHVSVLELHRQFKMAGFKRSRLTLQRRREMVLGGSVQARVDNGVYSGQQAGEIIGVSGKMISYFIRLGLLKAERAGINTKNGEMHAIQSQDLRKFVIEHTVYVNLECADKFSFVDLLCPKK